MRYIAGAIVMVFFLWAVAAAYGKSESVLVGTVVPLASGANGSELQVVNEAQVVTKAVAVEVYADGTRVDYLPLLLPPKSSRTLWIRQDQFSSLPPGRVYVTLRGINDIEGVVAGIKRVHERIEYFSFLVPWTSWFTSIIRETPLRATHAVGIAAKGSKPFNIKVALLAKTKQEVLATAEYRAVMPGTQIARYLWQFFSQDYQSWVDIVGENKEVIFSVTCDHGAEVAVNISRIEFSSIK